MQRVLLTEISIADASHLQSKVQNKEGEAERQAGLSGQALGAKADSAVCYQYWTIRYIATTDTFVQQVERAKAEGKEISSELNRYSKDAERRLESGRKEAKSGVIGAVDNIDQNVEKGAGKVTQSVSDGADKAKSSISSWFGGSN